MKKTILLVAMPNSIHTARWIKQFKDQNWDIHLFSSVGGAVIHPHPEIVGVTFHSPLFAHAYRIGISQPGNKRPTFIVKLLNETAGIV